MYITYEKGLWRKASSTFSTVLSYTCAYLINANPLLCNDGASFEDVEIGGMHMNRGGHDDTTVSPNMCAMHLPYACRAGAVYLAGGIVSLHKVRLVVYPCGNSKSGSSPTTCLARGAPTPMKRSWDAVYIMVEHYQGLCV